MIQSLLHLLLMFLWMIFQFFVLLYIVSIFFFCMIFLFLDYSRYVSWSCTKPSKQIVSCMLLLIQLAVTSKLLIHLLLLLLWMLFQFLVLLCREKNRYIVSNFFFVFVWFSSFLDYSGFHDHVLNLLNKLNPAGY